MKKDLIKITFKISNLDITVFKTLMRSERRLTVSCMSDMLNRDRTTIQKSVQRLCERKLINRFQHNFDNGGYRYSYESIDLKTFNTRLKNIIMEMLE